MKYINICGNKPYYNKDTHLAQYFDESGDNSNWYKQDYFKINQQ